MTTFLAYNSLGRVALLILACVGFVVLGFWMTGAFGDVPTSGRYSASTTVGVGWVCVVFFALSAIAWAKRFFDDDVQLEVGPSGVRWAPWSDQLIPWSEITDVTTWSYNCRRLIVLHLKNRGRFPGRGILGRVVGANRILTGGDIAISLTGLDRDYDETMEAIVRFRPKFA